MTIKDGHIAGAYERLKAARSQLGFTQKQMGEALGMSINTYAATERGDRVLGLDEAMRLQEMGFSFQWLMHGSDPLPAPAMTAARLDPELMARIMDELVKLYKELNQRLTPLDQGRFAARMYNDLMVADPEEREITLRVLLKIHRNRMEEASVDPIQTKRQGFEWSRRGQTGS